MCLGNLSKDFTAIDIEKARLSGYVYEFSVGYNIIDTSYFIYIHKYLMKKMLYEIMFRLIKKIFMGL